MALELIRQARALGRDPDAILVRCGGGGLAAAALSRKFGINGSNIAIISTGGNVDAQRH